ncbi:MAG: Alpha amylase, catalytic region [Candidatus Roizmanbacteria bacterium GW2011_GWA2_37_7]|uniref:Alpha amylase, catalytic region n=1 Tax=Candidatus Roizmanbacteria bacterium GW2011_GWA2_37_7 TaxID=1618481 RepID=A0A0G0H6N4_9BACT|nr:MAG: Alpha amylase, catalytic region [Candidatus Roizmanbacteria bacterium GW2011_GWA2_37_7]
MNSTWGARVVYQIYPRSFKDSSGDGIGDLNGITEKLDYLKDLGIGALWLSPIYCSPMHDFGYDISNYYDIDPIFGTLSDFDNLLRKAHDKDMKVLMDFVPNHTSFEHPWFKESRSSQNNHKRDWYIWKKPKKNGSAPNNWLSQFGGSAWKFDEKTEEYYLHTFDVSQPDLNWRNPHVVDEILNVMRYWLKRGVDGFRVDVAYYLYKDPFFRDEPYNPAYLPELNMQYDSLLHIYTLALPETLHMLKKFHSVINEFDDRFMVCEIYTFLQEIVNLYRIVDHQSFAPFNFSFLSLPWNAQEQKRFIDEFDEMIGDDFFPTYVLGNHDKPRIVTKLGEDAARTAALLQLTLRGIPFIYYGEELGMKNMDIPKEKMKDPMALNMKGFHFGRDPVRTPMQWDTTQYGGFSNVEPWLPIEKESAERNVASEEIDKESFLSLYKSILNLRKTRKSLTEGKYIPLECKNPHVLGFIRRGVDEETLILANFSEEIQGVELPTGDWKTILSTKLDVKNRKEQNRVNLRPFEGIVLCI